MEDQWRLFRRDDSAGPVWIMLCTGVSLPDDGVSAGRTLCTTVDVELTNPTPSGIGTSDEVDQLEETVTALEQCLHRDYDALYVARARGHGKVELVIYSAPESDAGVSDRIASAFEGREIALSQIQDASWSVYKRMMPNTEEHWRSMLEEASRSAAHGGDVIEAARVVDHYSYFPDQEQSREFASRIRSLGMKSEVRPAAEPQVGEEWLVLSHHRCSARPVDMLPVVLKLVELARSCGGRYDGWEMPVVRKSLWGRVRRLFGAG